MYGWHSQTMGGEWWIVMFIGMVVFGGLFAVGITSLLRHDQGRVPSVRNPQHDAAAIGILKERLARGELSEADYAHRLNLLKEKS